MSLLKRIGFGLFIILAVTGATWAYLSLKKSKKPAVEALSVLPDSCLVYVNTADFFELNKKLNSQNLLVDKLKLFRDIGSFCATLQTVDSLLSTNEQLHKEMEGNSLHFAMYRQLNWLIAFNIKQLGDQDAITEQLRTLFHASKADNDVYAFKLGIARQIYFTLNAGVALISESRETIARALAAKTPKLQKNPSFIAFKSTLAENNPLAIYTDHKLYNSSKASSKLDLAAIFKKGTSAGTIDLQPSQITVNGFASCDSTELLSLLSNQEAAESDFIEQLPMSTTSFTAYGFGSFETLQEKRKHFFDPVASAFWKEVNDSASYNLELDFYRNVNNCFVAFETDPNESGSVMLNIKDSVKADEHLHIMGDSIVEQQGFKIYHLRSASREKATRLFSPLTENAMAYMAMRGVWLFFAATREALFYQLSELGGGSSLASNKSFMLYKSQNFPEAFNFLVYSSPNQMQKKIHPFFNFKTESEINPFENFKHFSFCVTNHASNFKFRWHLLNEAETRNKDQNVLWSLNLDEPCNMTAATFVNHVSNENELVIQDNANRLYLLNAKGTVLWKKQINEKIESPVFTVDAFKNNKYQLLFSTKNYLHLVDRNGNEVSGYPVKLPSEASSPLALHDYDHDKNYRLFIACQNHKIYNYSIDGAKLEGFAPVKTEGEVNLPVQYVKVGASDYLVTIDREGRIYTFSRKGANRIGLKNRCIENCSAFYIDATNNINSTFMVYVDDKNSLINKISFADKKEIVKLNADLDHAKPGFALIDENRTMDLVFATAAGISAYDLNGNLLFEKNTGILSKEVSFYSDGNRSVFSSLNDETQELMLTDQLKGNTTFYKASAMPLICDLFNDKKSYLVITNGNRLNCVLLN